MFSVDPANREAAVAAAATLSSVPSTSTPFGGVAGETEFPSVVGCCSPGAVETAGSAVSCSGCVMASGTGVESEDMGRPVLDGGEPLRETGRTFDKLGSNVDLLVSVELSVLARGVSVVCTTPCTRTRVPGGGKGCRPGGVG